MPRSSHITHAAHLHGSRSSSRYAARVANHFWTMDGGGGRTLASALQSDMSAALGVDIHPASRWGRGITMDHGGGCVIGETAVIGDNVRLQWA